MEKCCSNSEVEMLLAFEFFDAGRRSGIVSRVILQDARSVVSTADVFVLLLICHAFVVCLAVSLNFNICCYP